MELLEHIVVHSLEDTLPLVPFLLVTYLVLEFLEQMAGDRVNAAVQRAGAAGPVVGALLGIVPQCGFSAMGATLYAGRVITIGTLVAVFLSTSDEMLPLLVAEQVDVGLVVQILAAKAVIAAIVGLAADAMLRALRKNPRAHAAVRRGVLGPHAYEGDRAPRAPDIIDELAEAGEGADHIHRLCERDHCGCDDDVAVSAGDSDELVASRVRNHEPEHGHCDHAHGHTHSHTSGHGTVFSVVHSAVSHTLQVTVFILVITLVLVAVLETVGEDALAAFLGANQAFSVFASALVGLIPNCAASVVITQLYLQGVLSFSAMFAGTLVGAGTGFLVLFRTNGSLRENLIILIALYMVGVLSGLVLMAFGV